MTRSQDHQRIQDNQVNCQKYCSPVNIGWSQSKIKKLKQVVLMSKLSNQLQRLQSIIRK